jgi:hypothetical protein
VFDVPVSDVGATIPVSIQKEGYETFNMNIDPASTQQNVATTLKRENTIVSYDRGSSGSSPTHSSVNSTVSGTTPAPTKRECNKTFILSGLGRDGTKKEVELTVMKRFQEFNDLERDDRLKADVAKYAGYQYTKIGDPSPTIDCAGYVANKLWNIGRYRVTAPKFYDVILKNFAHKITTEQMGWEAVQPGDVLVYGSSNDAKHVTYIKSVNRTMAATSVLVETKDGSEAVYENEVVYNYFSNDPLVRAYGPPHVYRIDVSKINIKEKNSGDCDEVQMKLTVQVIDETTNRPVSRANVTVSAANKSYPASNTSSTKGEYSFQIPKDVTVNSLRVIAKATDYEERWSDITVDFLQSSEPAKYYTVFLKKKSASGALGEKKYGPYTITAAGWQSTGLLIKPGGSFRVEATGNIRHPEDKSPEGGHNPDGRGAENYWNWWVMAAKIGKERVREVGSKGGFGTTEGGILELGVPRAGDKFVDDDLKRVGSFTVYVYSKDAEQVETRTAKSMKAREHRGFLQTVLYGQTIPNKDPEQIAQEVKFIVYEYNLTRNATFNECITSIKQYHEYFHNRLGSPTGDQKRKYESCVLGFLNELNTLINTGSL